ncbi:MAG: nucleotidyltransferase [Terriglobales bacterium]
MPELSNTEEKPKTSSQPSEVPREQVELFRDVLTDLENCRVPYAVSGAFSLRQHTGICRYTKDLDLFLTAKNSNAALSCLHAAGMDCGVSDPVWLSKAWRDGYFVDLISGMSNGVITVEDSWIARARPAVVFGVETRVLAAEELVASKIFVAKRERFDGSDIAHVIYGTYGNFDWKREMEIVGEHWEMLLWSLVLFRYVYPAQSHYVPSDIWCELVTRFTREIKNRDPQALFRGSLIDEYMFAIDVDEWEQPDLLEESRQRRLARMERDQATTAKTWRKEA